MTESQYAAKFVCGPSANQPLVEDGDYKTTINIHNPQFKSINFRYKTALAATTSDGPISNFVSSNIGPDAAQAFDCDIIRKLSGTAPGLLIDGFLVLESTSPLDVTGYYTAAKPAQNGTAIHIEKFAARAVPPHDPLCQKDVSINLADVNNWQTSNANLAVAVTPLPGAWDSTRAWMSYGADAAGAANADFTYQLDFCSCSGGARVTGNVKSDNAALGVLNTTGVAGAQQTTQIFDTGTPSFPNGPGNFKPTPTNQPVPMSGAAPVSAGSGNIVITVRNLGGPTGVSVIGSLSLTEGHVGACPP